MLIAVFLMVFVTTSKYLIHGLPNFTLASCENNPCMLALNKFDPK